MRLDLLSSKAIYQRSVDVASLMKIKRKKKEEVRRKFNFYCSLVLDVDDHFEFFLRIQVESYM